MIASYRAMPIEEKAQLIRRLEAGATRMAVIGIRERFPDASDEEVRLRLGALRIEPALMVAAFGWDPDVRGR